MWLTGTGCSFSSQSLAVFSDVTRTPSARSGHPSCPERFDRTAPEDIDPLCPDAAPAGVGPRRCGAGLAGNDCSHPEPRARRSDGFGRRVNRGEQAKAAGSRWNDLRMAEVVEGLRGVPRKDLVLAFTEVQACALVPEIRLHLATDTMALWERLESAIGRGELAPPFWATAWAGGLALARHLLDRPEIVHGRDVVDIASGSGLVAIAAALAGARSVTAYDVDELAVAAAAMNAGLNEVEISTEVRDVREVAAARGSLVTAGDVFYAVEIADAMGEALRRLVARGVEVLIGDPHRPLLPAEGLEPVADYQVAVDVAVEAVEVKAAMVARLRPETTPIGTARPLRR